MHKRFSTFLFFQIFFISGFLYTASRDLKDLVVEDFSAGDCFYEVPSRDLTLWRSFGGGPLADKAFQDCLPGYYAEDKYKPTIPLRAQKIEAIPIGLYSVLTAHSGSPMGKIVTELFGKFGSSCLEQSVIDNSDIGELIVLRYPEGKGERLKLAFVEEIIRIGDTDRFEAVLITGQHFERRSIVLDVGVHEYLMPVIDRITLPAGEHLPGLIWKPQFDDE